MVSLKSSLLCHKKINLIHNIMKISSKHLQKQFARVGRIFPKRNVDVVYSEIGYSKLKTIESAKTVF